MYMQFIFTMARKIAVVTDFLKIEILFLQYCSVPSLGRKISPFYENHLESRETLTR